MIKLAENLLSKLRANNLDQRTNISLAIGLTLFKVANDFKDELEFLRTPHKISTYISGINFEELERSPKVSTLKKQLELFPIENLLYGIQDELDISEPLNEIKSLDFSKEISRGNYFNIVSDFIEIQMILLSSLGKTDETTTPKEISYILNKCLNVLEDETLLDPCWGIGAMALTLGKKAVNLQGQEINLWAHSIGTINAIISNKDFNILKGDSIENPQFNKADVVVSNIPFGVRNIIVNENILNWDKPSKINGDFHFTSLLLSFMEKRGAIILPEGALFRSGDDGKVRGNIINEGFISTVISLPPKLFNNTNIASSIVLFNKEVIHDEVFFIDTKDYFKPTRGGVEISNDELDKLVSIIMNRQSIEGISTLVTKEELSSNDYILTVNRYVYKSIQLEKIDTEELSKELEVLESEMHSYQTKTNELLNKITKEG